MSGPDTLDRLLTSLAFGLHAASACFIPCLRQLAFGPFEAVTVHCVLEGEGAVRVGAGPSLPFARHSIIVVPARQVHIIGDGGAGAQAVAAEDHCSLLADGLVKFTAGDGAPDTVLLCGMIPAAYRHALGLLELLREPMIEDVSNDATLRGVFGLMRAEVANPRLGTRAMAEVLIKHCLIAMFRRQLTEGAGLGSLAAALQQPRLARVLSIVENPALPHTVSSLAALAGMSRASFAEHFARAFGQGPIDFVQTVRLQVAANLLATTDIPLKTIGHSIGYTAPAAFSRAFRQRYGTVPQAYRADARLSPFVVPAFRRRQFSTRLACGLSSEKAGISMSKVSPVSDAIR